MSAAPGSWLEVSVPRPQDDDAADLLAEALLAAGGRAVEERDGRLLTHLEAGDDPDAVRRAVQSALEGVAPPMPAGAVEWREVPHREWSEIWKAGLKTRRISERLVVTPSWIGVEPREGEVVLVVDPGMAFGTAEHETTRGCLRLLDRAVEAGQRVADVGAGSGILSMAAAGLGAREVVALEGDPLACEVMRENLAHNGFTERVRVEEAWADGALLDRLGPLDGIVANIESGVLRPLLDPFRGALAPSGWLILSGILETEWSGMEAAAARAGFRLREVDAEGPWRSGLFGAGG